MKKSLIALSVAGLIAGSASAVTVYNNNGTTLEVNGSARVMLTKAKNERVDLQNDGSRIKFKFSQQISDGFSALGFMELRPGVKSVSTTNAKQGNNGSVIDASGFDSGIMTKYLYAGLQADGIGSLTFGRQKTAGDNFKLADPAEQDVAINDAMGIITEGKKAITFKSADFYGFGLEASYIFNDTAEKTFVNKGITITSPNRNSYQILARYENTFGELGFKAHALYSHRKDQAMLRGTQDLYGEDSFSTQLYGLSTAISYADLGLAVDYVRTKITNSNAIEDLVIGGVPIGSSKKDYNKASGLQVALTYQVMEPMDVYAIYHHYTYEGTNLKQAHGVLFPVKATSDTKAVINGFGVGTHYYLSQNVMTYLEYNRDKVSGKAEADHAAYLGLRVFF